MAVSQVLRSEWTKIKSVRSTVWTLGLAAVVTAGLGALICVLSKNDFKNLSQEDRLTFDPTFISFAGMGLGQLAMIVFGVLVVGNEYSTGMIRTSLAAVPQRGAFLFGKVAVATVLALVVGLITSFVTFFLGQSLLGSHQAALGDPGVLRAVVGGGLYMTLIAVFSMALATMLRSPMLSLGILMPFFFLISNILGGVSATKKYAQYLPDQAGQKVMQVIPPLDDDTPYGPWGGLVIMLVWVAAAMVCGYLFLKKRDA
ncbi:ABC transporter permease subunit [Streptomyces sp. H27-D2]|uniref:ABC transporter permease subunit n=1 Tax=Streptomyces sp. H27-D2 TaxID=3046304 RepID=UPI002DB9BB93|nr:ABC transporter permease subunit [Streptomyces sp. H27-D2]MEC4018401.1 ABC transporter permease subunit [Streptomyces sp. H27-D2]